MWFYNGELFEEVGDHAGFVYLITNLENGKKYVGKKTFHFTKTRQLKGKKKRYKVESDWREYYGSNTKLNEDVKNLGPEKFRREILYLCKNKAEMSYFELREQVDRRVIEVEDYYNDWLMARVRRHHLKISPRQKPE